MKIRKAAAALFGAAFLTACTTDNHGSPVAQNLYEPVMTTGVYQQGISKIAGPKVELLEVREGHIAAQFNQDGLEFAVVSPGEIIIKPFLIYLDSDDEEVVGFFNKQPFPEPVYAGRDIVTREVSFDDLVEAVDKKIAQKITEDDNPDIKELINDGSIRIAYEIGIREDGVTTPSGTSRYIDAAYFTGEKIDLLAWGELPASISEQVQTVDVWYMPMTTCDGNSVCITTMLPMYDYTKEAQVVMDVEGGLDDMERSQDNAGDYFNDNQVVNFALVDNNSSTTTTANGKVYVTTELGNFDMYISRAEEGDRLHVNIPNWAGEVKKVEFVGFASVDSGGGHENVDIVATLDAA